MYKGGKNQINSESQAKEKLALYVYEYLMHLGAKNSAQTFVNEIRWDKGFSLGEAPGFLISWWCVFWDLYCAATPDRRENGEPSTEAKVFHEYTSSNILNQTGQQEVLQPPNMMNSNPFFQPTPSQPANNQIMMPGQQYQRFHPGPRPIRMPSNMEFNQQNPNNMNPGNPNQINSDQNRVAAGMSPLSRLTPPGNRMSVPPQQQQGQQQQQGPGGNVVNQMNYNGPPPPPPPQQQPPMAGPQGQQMRPVGPGQPPPGIMNNNPNQMQQQPGMPNASQQQQQQQQQMSNAPMSPMSIPQTQRWTGPNSAGPPGQQQPQAQQQQLQPPPPPPPAHSMNYTSSSSPVSFGNVQMGHHGPGTPIIQSPQDANGDMNYNNLMKNVPGGMQFHDQNIGNMVPLNTEVVSHHSHLNNEIIDSIKHSPIPNMQAVNRHGEDHSGSNALPDLNSFANFNDY